LLGERKKKREREKQQGGFFCQTCLADFDLQDFYCW
jgi:hypothetical protein